ncbi:MAG: RNA polymerase sigma factor [Clostridia bacterium]|nr:RNA polymerase sigma factor [Clostridia bacterium]
MNGTNIDSLLRKIAQGDNKAFETLYIRTSRGVYAFLYGYFHSHADTEDAMQTVYLKVKTGIGSYRAGTNGRAWLLQIAKNHALNELAKRKNTVSIDETDIPVRESFDEGFTSELRKILTEEEYQIVTLHVLWRYKHREIAEMLSYPTGTVTSKYKRAIEKLKARFKEE